MQALVLEQRVGRADTFAELARVGKVGVGQARFEAVVIAQQGEERGGGDRDDQQAHEALPTFPSSP
jgi:hypothetical protein